MGTDLNTINVKCDKCIHRIIEQPGNKIFCEFNFRCKIMGGCKYFILDKNLEKEKID